MQPNASLRVGSLGELTERKLQLWYTKRDILVSSNLSHTHTL